MAEGNPVEAQNPTVWHLILETLGLRKERKLDLGLGGGNTPRYATPAPKPGSAVVLEPEGRDFRFPAPGTPELRKVADDFVKRNPTYVGTSGRVMQTQPFEARANAANLATQERYGELPPADPDKTQLFMERHLTEAITDPAKKERARAKLRNPNRSRRDFAPGFGEGIWKL